MKKTDNPVQKAPKRNMNIINGGAPDSHANLIKQAKKQLHGIKPDKFSVKVYERRNDIFDTSNIVNKFVYELRSYSKQRLETTIIRQKKMAKNILTFGEIKALLKE